MGTAFQQQRQHSLHKADLLRPVCQMPQKATSTRRVSKRETHGHSVSTTTPTFIAESLRRVCPMAPDRTSTRQVQDGTETHGGNVSIATAPTCMAHGRRAANIHKATLEGNAWAHRRHAVKLGTSEPPRTRARKRFSAPGSSKLKIAALARSACSDSAAKLQATWLGLFGHTRPSNSQFLS